MAAGLVPAVGEACASRRFEVCVRDLQVERRARRSYKNRTRITTTLPPAASRCIVLLLRLCCRRTHFFGTISGSRPTSFCCFWPSSSGDAVLSASSRPFFAFAILGSIGQLVVYAADILPSVSARLFWSVDWGDLILEGILKFALIGEIFALVFGAYASLARLGKTFYPRGWGRSGLCSRCGRCVCPKERSLRDHLWSSPPGTNHVSHRMRHSGINFSFLYIFPSPMAAARFSE